MNYGRPNVYKVLLQMQKIALSKYNSNAFKMYPELTLFSWEVNLLHFGMETELPPYKRVARHSIAKQKNDIKFSAHFEKIHHPDHCLIQNLFNVGNIEPGMVTSKADLRFPTAVFDTLSNLRSLTIS